MHRPHAHSTSCRSCWTVSACASGRSVTWWEYRTPDHGLRPGSCRTRRCPPGSGEWCRLGDRSTAGTLPAPRAACRPPLLPPCRCGLRRSPPRLVVAARRHRGIAAVAGDQPLQPGDLLRLLRNLRPQPGDHRVLVLVQQPEPLDRLPQPRVLRAQLSSLRRTGHTGTTPRPTSVSESAPSAGSTTLSPHVTQGSAAYPRSIAIYDSVVDIEELLLRFPPQAALHAWRLFRLRAEGKRLVLSSPMYHDDTTGLTPLWPCLEAEATCYTGHPAPARDADAASTALSPGRSTRSQASFATPRTSTIRGPMPRSPATGVYSLTCEASEPSMPGLYASPCPTAAGLARPAR